MVDRIRILVRDDVPVSDPTVLGAETTRCHLRFLIGPSNSLLPGL